MAEERKESKYARNRAARFSRGGRILKSLGDGAIQARGAEAVNPMPRPFDPDYFPKHTISYHPQPEPIPMKHEDKAFIARLRNRDHKYPPSKFKKKPEQMPMIKYDHYRMNYYGWNS